MTNRLQHRKLPIEIVGFPIKDGDFPIKNGDFPVRKVSTLTNLLRGWDPDGISEFSSGGIPPAMSIHYYNMWSIKICHKYVCKWTTYYIWVNEIILNIWVCEYVYIYNMCI